MGIGSSIALLTIGAILTFALDVQVGWLNFDVVGWILMASGTIGLILTLAIWNSKRTTKATIIREPVVREPLVVREPQPPTVPNAPVEVRRDDVTRPLP